MKFTKISTYTLKKIEKEETVSDRDRPLGLAAYR
jgi:hypothetical protein